MRRRAFYASPCQATTPSLERFTHCAHSAGPLRDHFQGLEIKPMFRRFLMLLQDDLGGRKWWPKEGQHRPKILLKSSQAPSKTGLEPGCRWESFWGAFWDPPEPRKSCSRCSAVLFSAKIADCARGSKIDPNLVQNRSQMPPGAVLRALKAVSKRAAISVPIFDLSFMIFRGPEGGAKGSNGI